MSEHKPVRVIPTKRKNIVDDRSRRPKFDFKKLNQDFNEAYQSFKRDASEVNRVLLYQSMFDLSWACISVSSYRRNPEADLRLIATEYAFNQLNRIIEGKFKPEPLKAGTLFPADKYFSLSIQRPAKEHFTRDHPNQTWQRLHVLIEDLEMFVSESQGRGCENVDGERVMGNITTAREYARDLFRALRLLYTEEEICRLLPLATEMLFVSNLSNLRDPDTPAPRDLRIFMDVLLVVSQRLAVTHNIAAELDLPKRDLKRTLDSALRSTLFLAAVSNYERVPRDLLLALDHRSLYRLAYMLGGTTVRIPSLRDLQTLQTAVQAAVAVYTAPEKERKKAMETVKQYDSIFSKKNGRVDPAALVSKMIESNRILRDDDSSTTPLINVILSAIKSLDAMVHRIHKTTLSPGQTLDQYVALSRSLSEIVDRIIALEDGNV